MSQQIIFSLGRKASYNIDDFFVAPANAMALKQLMLFPNWGVDRLANICMIRGPHFSGKTHLAHIFAQISGAKFIDEAFLERKETIDKLSHLIIDDLDLKLHYEEQIFHIFNECLDRKKFLLLLSSQSVQAIDFKTQDCASRMLAINQIEIVKPSIELIEAMLYKNFADRQISLAPEVVKYILLRIERSYESTRELIERLDEKSLGLRSKITVPLVKEVLEELESFYANKVENKAH